MAPVPEPAAGAWAASLVATLGRAGVERFVISPGSRSTPLAVAAARQRGARCVVAHDERAAGFYAAGYGRAAGRPAALICTSGTAVANYLPAVIEASQADVPLIVLSADRPPELRATGANQTIDQPDLFGRYVRWRFDLPCPGPDTPPDTAAHAAAAAVAHAVAPPAGPVHLNCMFREPLAPGDRCVPGAARPALYTRADVMPPEADVAALAERLGTARTGVLAVGPLRGREERDAAAALARALRWPVFADAASGLRADSIPGLIPFFDLALLPSGAAGRLAPEVVLHAGGRMTSTRFLALARGAGHYIHIADSPRRRDPEGIVTLHVQASLGRLAGALAAAIRPAAEGAYAAELRRLPERAEAAVDRVLGDELSEPACARLVARNLPEGHGLFLGRSMPVRDMDMFGPPLAGPRAVGVNWGASGIDGTIASALGFADGSDAPLTLLVGDMALLHDLSSLALVARHRQPLTLVLLNNGGGGIFSFLPLESCADLVEEYFAAAHGLAFKSAAELFGLPYAAPADLPGLRAAYTAAAQGRMPAIIEVAGDRARNRDLHRRLYAAVTEDLT